MTTPPEIVHTNKRRVICDGATDIRSGSALGHPRVFLQIDEKGYVECGYCDRRFVLDGDALHRNTNEIEPGALDDDGPTHVG